jgi:hypothetical protein
MAKWLMEETIHSFPVWTSRLGTTSNRFNDKDVGKPLKQGGESAMVLAGDGDAIEGICSSVDLALVDQYTLGGYHDDGRKYVTFSGTVAIGDLVVAADQGVAQNVALSSKYMKVKKAADQDAAAAAPFVWRVVSLGAAGTGASGTNGLIQRV